MKLAGDSGKSPYLKGVRAMKIMPECGTMRENEAAFDMAVAAITSGDLAWGHCILVALRDHICSTGEHKSVQWMVPQVLETLAALKTCTPTPYGTCHRGEGRVSPDL